MKNIITKLKIHRRKIVLLFSYLSVALFIFINFSFLISSILILLFLIIVILNETIRTYIKSGSDISNYNERNLEYLLFGSTRVWKFISENNICNKRLISFAFYKRSLHSDFLILKQKFSYLSKHGKVLITIDCQDLVTISSHRLYFPDVQLLHQITLNNLHINRHLVKYASFFPLIFFPVYSFKMLSAKLFNTHKYAKVTGDMRDQMQVYITSSVCVVVEFCLHRQLVPKIVFINCEEPRHNILKIKSEIARRYKYNDFYFLRSVDELKKII